MAAKKGAGDKSRTSHPGKRSGKRGDGSARLPRGSGASHVYEQLREDILGLRIAPGTLLDESVLATQFRMSRSPVREALIRLSAEGLIHTLPNRSPIVAPFDIGSVPSFLDSLELLYRASARLAAIYCTAGDLREIEAIQSRLEKARESKQITLQIALNREFHVAVAEAGGNVYLTKWLRTLMDQGQRLMRLSVYFEGESTPRSALAPHEDMIAAIRRQDGDRAEEAGRRDAAYLRDELLQEFSRRQLSAMKLESAR